MGVCMSILNKFFSFYRSYFVPFVSSFSFNIVLFAVGLFFICGVIFTPISFINSLLILIFVIHGILGFSHVIEDYTFDSVCKLFFVFLLNLLLIKLIFLCICL